MASPLSLFCNYCCSCRVLAALVALVQMEGLIRSRARNLLNEIHCCPLGCTDVFQTPRGLRRSPPTMSKGHTGYARKSACYS